MKNQRLLSLIKERLNQLGPHEVIRQLYECRTEGPSVKEFFDEDDIEHSYLFNEDISISLNKDLKCHIALVAVNDESYFDAWENCSQYDMAA